MSRLQDNFSNTDMLSGDLIRKFVNDNLSDKSYAKLQELPNNVKDYVSPTRTVPIWYIYDNPVIPDPAESLQISQFGDNSKFGIPQMPGSIVKVKEEELKELPKEEPERRKTQLCTALTLEHKACRNIGVENGCCRFHQPHQDTSTFELPNELPNELPKPKKNKRSKKSKKGSAAASSSTTPAVVADDQINQRAIAQGAERQGRRPSNRARANRESVEIIESLSS